MFKFLRIVSYYINRRKRDELRRLALGIFVLAVAFLLVPNIITPVHASEPSLAEIFEHLGFINVAGTDVETFPAGLYEITLYAEFAAYCDENELSYYEVGSSTYNIIFTGPQGGSGYLDTPLTDTFDAGYEFGLYMLTPEGHTYYTETSDNPDGEKHAIVYENLDDSFMFLIGFENLYAAGDRDYQDIVFSLKLCTPQQVIPEVPFGTILSFLSMFIAFVGFVGFKRFPR